MDRATAFGKQADCPFCRARARTDLKAGDHVVILSGPDCGQEGRLTSASRGPGDLFLQVDPNDSSQSRSLRRTDELLAKLDDLRVPAWLPPFDLDRAWRIEELAWEFCQQSAMGLEFCWSEERAAGLVGTIWDGRIDLRPSEFSGLLIAHGMPSHFQTMSEDFFRIGQSCLISARNHRPCKTWRKPDALTERFSQILRYSYHWHCP